MITSQEKYLFRKATGTHVRPYIGESCYNTVKLMNFISGLKEGQFGWIDLTYPDGYVSHTHFTCNADGQPRFTNASFDKTDIETVRRVCGDEAANILLANHL